LKQINGILHLFTTLWKHFCTPATCPQDGIFSICTSALNALADLQTPRDVQRSSRAFFSKKFDNIVVCLCELAPSQIRPVTTLWCYTHFIRTLIDRMRPLFTKSGLVFDCEIIDTVARQKGGLCLVHLCVGVQYQACKGCVGHVQCSLRSGIGAGSCQLGPPSRTATGLERVILIEMMNAVCHRALHLWQEKVGNLQPMLQVGTTLCKLWFKFMCF